MKDDDFARSHCSSCNKLRSQEFLFSSLLGLIPWGEQGRHGRLFDCGEVQFEQQLCSIIANGHRSLCSISLPATSSANHRHRIEAVANAEVEAEAEAKAVTELGAVRNFFEHSYLTTLKSNMFGAY